MKNVYKEALEVVGETFGLENPIVNPHSFSENAEHCWIKTSDRLRTTRGIRILIVVMTGLSSTGLCLEKNFFQATVIVAAAVVYFLLSMGGDRKNNNARAMASLWSPFRKFLIKEFKARGVVITKEGQKGSSTRVMLNTLAAAVAKDKVDFEYTSGEEKHRKYDKEKSRLSEVARYCGMSIRWTDHFDEAKKVLPSAQQ